VMRHNFPYAEAGQRIGLLGGSFDPPHWGHVHISKEALKRFHLDQVWWLVSPGNPLKREEPARLDRRIAAGRALADDPRIVVSDLERRLGTRLTAQTLNHTQRLYPGVRFVWLMGADNLATFHLWQDWRGILGRIPVGILARPGHMLAAGLSPAAQIFDQARLPAGFSPILPLCPPPCWCLVSGPTVGLSSSAIRSRGEWAL